MTDENEKSAAIVFAHIEKSAGTSFRTLLWRNYGRESVFWYGIDLPFTKKLKASDLAGYRVIGGHFDLCLFDDVSYPTLQVAFIRDPVERAVSLFHYYTQGTTQENRSRWIEWGIKAESIVQSIRQSRPFRRAIENMQCRRVCGKRSFQAAIEHARSRPFLLGRHERIGEHIEELASALNWRHKRMSRENVGREGYRDRILAEPGAIEAIEELNGQDRLLHEAAGASEQYATLEGLQGLDRLLAPSTHPSSSYFARDDAGRIRIIPSVTRIELSQGRHKRLTLRVVNRSDRLLRAQGAFRVMLGTHWDSTSGVRLLHEGPRTALTRDVPPGGTSEEALTLSVPEQLEPGEYTIVLSLIHRGITWLDQIESAHVGRLDVRVS